MISRTAILVLLFSAIFSYGQKNSETEKKIDKLMSKMTIDEKIGQLNQLSGEGLSQNIVAQVKNGSVGSLLNEVDSKVIYELQKVATTQTRLRIPLIFARDVIHGFKTIFPIPLGQAASWNTSLVEDGARIAAIEASSVGIKWTFAPMIDVSRDPRWGRIAESFGEDSYLISKMGAASVRGYQGKNLADKTAIAACAKHFAGYGATESGKDYNTTWIPEVQLRDTYLPPFKAAVDAQVATFMCSFNDINGVPSSGNKHLNDDILRKEWKFNGVLVSDWASIEQMQTHGVAANLADAAKLAIDAKVDMDMMGFAYTKNLKDLIKNKSVKIKQIDAAVRNVLRLKFNLGLFDNPFAENSESTFYANNALSSAQKAATESVVLLKNNGLLPINKDHKTVAVMGPLANSPADQLGTWVMDGEPNHSITPLDAIHKNFGKNFTIQYEQGLAYSRDTNSVNFSKAIQLAQNSDVIVFFAGEEALLSGEARARADINLPGAQTKLLTELKKTGKPLVLVVMAGRPHTIQKEIEMADAVLYSFHPGTMGGPALANIIFGVENPSGKLPVTFPRLVGQVPIYYAHKMTGRPAKDIQLINEIPVGAPQFSLGFTSYHLDAGDSPLFPFGFGLSYTNFNYSPVKLSATTLTRENSITANCKVSNTGKMDGYEVVQLYVRDKVASLAQPVKRLIGFEKIFLKSGESKELSFDVSANQLSFHDSKNNLIVENGEFDLWISTNSNSGSPQMFILK